MMKRIIFLAVCLTTCVQGSQSGLEGFLDALTRDTDEAMKKVLETSMAVNKSAEDFDEMTSERLESVLWECTVQKKAVDEVTTQASMKGITNNKLFLNFQCISTKSDETIRKLEEIKSKIPEDSRRIKEKGLARIKPFGLILPGLYEYVQDLRKRKTEELNKATEEQMYKIIKEVRVKLELLKAILNKTNDFVRDLKYKFLEEHIGFTFVTENNLKKIQREGGQQIMKCVS